MTFRRITYPVAPSQSESSCRWKRGLCSQGADGVSVRWTNDSNAPAVAVREESLLETYPYDNADLARKLKERYLDFKQDASYQKRKALLLDDPKYCRKRLYN